MAAFTLASPLGGRLTARFGPRVPLTAGMVLLALSFLGLARLSAESTYLAQWPWLGLLGIGMGITIVAATDAIVGNVPGEHSGVAGGLQTTAGQLGGVLGISLFGVLIAGNDAFVGGMQTAMWVGAGIALMSALLAIAVEKPQPGK